MDDIAQLFNRNIPHIHIARKSEKKLIEDIFTEVFQKDPCINWLTAPSKSSNKIKNLIEYVVDEAFENGFVTVSDTLNGAALWLNDKNDKISFNFFKRNLKYWFKNGTKSSLRALKLEHLAHLNFPKNKNFIYLLMIGVAENAQDQGIGGKLLHPIIEKAKESNIPIFLDTCNPVNVSIYESMGFRVINSYQTNGTLIRFLKLN